MTRASGGDRRKGSKRKAAAPQQEGKGEPDPRSAPPTPPARSFGPRERQQFLVEYAKGGTVEDAAATVPVSSVTVYARVRSDPVFAAQYALSREYNTDALEDRLARMASGNVAALFGTLKARRPARWRDNVRVEHVQSTGAEALREARRRAAEANAQSATVAQPPQAAGAVAPKPH